MSWLGKILTFVVLIAALVGVYMTVNVYVTRTNWKVQADNYKTALATSEANRQKELRSTQAEKAELVRLLEAEKKRATDLNKSLDDFTIASKKTDEEYKRILTKLENDDVAAKLLQARTAINLNELTETRKRNAELQDQVVQLVLQKAAADRDKLSAENDARLARSIADELTKKNETLTAQNIELRQTGGSGTAAVLRGIDKIPAPLPEGIRGTVTRDVSSEGFVQINIGIDAGLEPGAKLDIYRTSGGGQYLGTVVVTKSVYPKEAIAEFRSAKGVPVSKLRPDELPRKGDIVGQLSGQPVPR